jgi:hypothetical protein
MPDSSHLATFDILMFVESLRDRHHTQTYLRSPQFGYLRPDGPREHALAAVVVAEYAVAFLLIFLHSNVSFASGYAVAAAVTQSWQRALVFHSIVKKRSDGLVFIPPIRARAPRQP